MSIKAFFSKIYSGRRAQAAIELSIAAMILVALIGAIISNGWSFAFANHNVLQGTRRAMTDSYRFSLGAFTDEEADIAAIFNPPGAKDSGSRSRVSATTVIVNDHLGLGDPGKYGTLTRVPYMIQGGPASHTNNMFMPLTEPLDYHLPRIDYYVNGQHFPFTAANFRAVNLYRPGSAFWEKYCLHAAHLRTVKLLDSSGGVALSGVALPLWDIHDNMVIDENNVYVGPDVSDSGEPIPHPLYAFKVWDLGVVFRVLPVAKYPNAPFVGCMRMYSREYNKGPLYGSLKRWCSGTGNGCPHICADERFDLDLSDQMFQEEPEPSPTAPRECAAYAAPDEPDVPAELRPQFNWQWSADAMGVYDDSEDDEKGSFATSEKIRLRYGYPLKRHDFADFPNSGYEEPGEPSIAGDRDLDEEQLIKVLQVDKYFGVVESVIVMDTSGDMNFSANDDEEVGFYFGAGDPDGDGEVTVEAPVNLYSQTKDGTFLRIEDSQSTVTTTRKKENVTLIERVIQLGSGASVSRWCSGTVDGEPNPVKACGDCESYVNQGVTCFDILKKRIYVRSIISDKRGHRWTAEKKKD